MSLDVEVTAGLGYDGRSLPVANFSDVSTAELASHPDVRQLAFQLDSWVRNARAAQGKTSMFNRATYTPPENPYDEMRAARHALKYDDITSGVAETTEAYAFRGVKWEAEEPDDADAFNQLARDQNLDACVRRMWRDEFGYSQTVVAKVWGWCEYTVRGKTKSGNRRKRSYRFWAPQQLCTLDPTMVVPVKKSPIAPEQLCWQANREEIDAYNDVATGARIDPLLMAFYAGSYEPSLTERQELVNFGIDPYRLLLLDPLNVFRHTVTKGDYERWPEVRLKSCFHLLDLKQQLINSDRAMLIGAANYILLVRKGSKEQPAQPEEIANLRDNFNVLAKLPVIISDHRLEIEIVAPRTDFVLDVRKYDVLDQRLLFRLFGALSVGAPRTSDDQTTMSLALARVMENRRHMLRRTLEAEIARQVVNHPRNTGVFTGEPNLVYVPRNIALSESTAYTQAILALRTQREVSRDTTLEFFGLDEATEAQRMQLEAEIYDDVFKTAVPYAAPPPGQQPPGQDGQPQDGQPPNGKQPPGKPTPNGTPEAPGVAGGRGGRPPGGGQSKQSPQAIAKPRTKQGNPKTQAAEEQQ